MLSAPQQRYPAVDALVLHLPAELGPYAAQLREDTDDESIEVGQKLGRLLEKEDELSLQLLNASNEPSNEAYHMDGPDGVTTFCGLLRDGRLGRQLKKLELWIDEVGDAGVTALVQVLPELHSLTAQFAAPRCSLYTKLPGGPDSLYRRARVRPRW